MSLQLSPRTLSARLGAFEIIATLAAAPVVPKGPLIDVYLAPDGRRVVQSGKLEILINRQR